VLGSAAVKKPGWVVTAALVGALTGGCKSNAVEICERLDSCHLLPKGEPTPADPNGFGVNDCEYQVENELDTSYREKCADCVASHDCNQIQDACRAVCNPPY
jgi:hypothetical protein